MVKITILDGYVDEPTCLGVPPYISPYPRYIAGAIIDADPHATISYTTIDQVRNSKSKDALSKSDIIIIIAGNSVPGRYLSGFPLSPKELPPLLNSMPHPFKILCGPAAKYGFGMQGGKKTKSITSIENLFDALIKGDPEIVIHEFIKNGYKLDGISLSTKRENAQKSGKFAIKGSNIVSLHPLFPDFLIAEIETYRGCHRSISINGSCSFCSEFDKGAPDFRPINDIIYEIKALYDCGIKHFRLGNQPCIFSYMAKDMNDDCPTPNPDAILKLFKGIRTIAPNLKTLHIDNANPMVLARFPKECREIAKTIVKYHTSGDVAAIGMESADPIVIKKNNLKASPDEVLSAIRLLNEVGSKRGANGMPELLPGLNFISGLIGESKNTFKLNYNFLKTVLDEGLMLRRINLRQVMPIQNTSLFETGSKFINKHRYEFQKFKKLIRETIDQPMLKRVIPEGTVLKSVLMEKHDGNTTFGRQMGTYPILIGVPGKFPLHQFITVKVTDYGYRSITAVPYPLDINTANRDTIEAISGIGKKRAIRILANRPFKNENEILEAIDDKLVGLKLLEFCKIGDL